MNAYTFEKGGFTFTRETRALILEEHPAAYIEITGPRGEVVE